MQTIRVKAVADARLPVPGTPGRFVFPRPMTDRPGLAFSFSGLNFKLFGQKLDGIT